MVGARVYPVEDDPSFAEGGQQSGVDDHDVGLAGQLATNGSLVCDDDERGTDPR